ncbi:cytochrome P450 [Streptomyces sp. NBC_01262]|uniref:cytochrome P450 n=1 Tax=Streptomyces sp. NBC_01262 TaxID=2903803 RepID=UPI002E314441|nr:cytochrome P450 [Streptomyces sp. NBC_01262]
MSTVTDANQAAGLPAFPGDRSARCPFDPPADYAKWRGAEGLQQAVWNGHTVWVVSRFEDIKAAMTDPRISADVVGRLQGEARGEGAPPIFPRMDDPEHARLRRMLTKDFTVKRVQAMRPHIQEMVDDFLDRMIDKGRPADIVRDFALPVPSLVISLLLGVPYGDHEFFQQHTSVMMSLHRPQEERNAASMALFGYLRDLVARKEREPGDDLISRLLCEHVANGEIDRDTVAMNGHILLNAGHETTANMIALSTLFLLRNPDDLARIRDTDDPAVVAGAVEELLRHLTIVHSLVARVAVEDVTIGGQPIKAGEGLIVNLPAGNRDPAFLPDPDLFDIGRSARGHVAFGHGTHQCIGQTLARAELEIALPTLLRQLPNLQLAVPFEELRFRGDMSIYGVHELPVTW